MASAAATERVSPTADRKILLVGASRGLGLGLAKSFAAHGWIVVATERRAPGGEGLAAAVAAANAISAPRSSTSTTRKPCKDCAHSFPANASTSSSLLLA
jgi:NAD(P)-dependent dehydrogenase (short-subunit alcohol dehydrogenase family)